MSSTATTAAIYALLRETALAFEDLTGDSLTSLGVPMYIGTGPAAPDWARPYVIMRLFNRTTSGNTHGQREEMQLELQVFGRPRGVQAQPVEQVGDILDGWLLQYRSAVAGLMFSKSRTRDTLPTFSDPADREVYQIRLVAAVTVWSQLFTQYTP